MARMIEYLYKIYLSMLKLKADILNLPAAIPLEAEAPSGCNSTI